MKKKMRLRVKRRIFNSAYYPYLWDNTRYLHFYGGSGSGKSVFVAQKLILESCKRKTDTLVIRKIKETLKDSVYKLIKQTIYQWNLENYFNFTKSPAEIINKSTGSSFVFKGLDDPEKVKSITGIQKIWIEEATELDLNDFLEIDRRLRGMDNHQIIFTYNPIDERHWLKTFFHNNPPEDCKIVRTTYLDNKFLDKHYKKTLDRMKEVDENQWRVYALGEWGVQNLAHKFDTKKLMNLQTKEPLQVADGVEFYKKPDKAQIYSLGVDPSSGLGDDYTAITVTGFYPDSEGKYPTYAQMKAKADERSTVRIVTNLANYFNQFGTCYIIPEANGIGSAVVNYIVDVYDNDLIYKRYITDPTAQLDTLIPKYGWVTNSNTRDKMINDTAFLFADDKLDVVNEEEKSEMHTFIYVQSDKDINKGRYEAQEGCNDDLLFSRFLSIAGFDYIRQYS